MIETAASVGSLPILGAVAPPCIELLVCRHLLAHQVEPGAALHDLEQPVGLDRRMADDLQQLLVRPDVMFQRRDVEIADEDRRGVLLGIRVQMLHLLDEIELVAELRIDSAIRLVAAGRNIEIMQADTPAAALEDGRDMPAVADIAIILAMILGQRNARGDGNAVIALLAVNDDVLVAERPERRIGKKLVRNLGLLQAEDIRPGLHNELLDDGHAQPHRVDVPGRNRKSHAQAFPSEQFQEKCAAVSHPELRQNR